MVSVVFYQESCGVVPFLTWLHNLPDKAKVQCLARLELLRREGHELRRPAAENLGGGLWELRVKSNRVNYRILYFFHGRRAVVVSHGFAKQVAMVPIREIEIASHRKRMYETSPGTHTYED